MAKAKLSTLAQMRLMLQAARLGIVFAQAEVQTQELGRVRVVGAEKYPKYKRAVGGNLVRMEPKRYRRGRADGSKRYKAAGG